MNNSDCEICKHWAASQSNDFPCDECENKTHFEYLKRSLTHSGDKFPKKLS